MQAHEKPSPETIRQARNDNPKMRERDLAHKLGVSEADLVAAYCGQTVRRLQVDVNAILHGLEAIGEVMALTRNESAVHEKIGVYDKVITNGHAALVLGEQIDLRVFRSHWVHGFAVERADSDGNVRRSLQFFDVAGDAVHKIHLRPQSDLHAYHALVDTLISQDQVQTVLTEPLSKAAAANAEGNIDLNELRTRWGGMTDVHQFVSILRRMNLSRRQAVHLVGDDFAWPLAEGSVARMMEEAVALELPIMCFVGSRGCIQIHSGPIANIKEMGPWLNVMDPTFHLHLRADRIAELWAVRKPNKDGHVTSIEAYDASGSLIIQFFGKRQEGEDERVSWRQLVEDLPHGSRVAAA